MDIDEMCMLMTKLPKRKHTKVRMIVNNRVQLTIQICINKPSGQQQHKIWRPRELKTTTIHKQGINAIKKQQSKIWDPRKSQREMRQQEKRLSKHQNKIWDLGRRRITGKTTCNKTCDNINTGIKGNEVIEHTIRRS
jgi:putative protein kinase ArgK-like GTPase of G3E family